MKAIMGIAILPTQNRTPAQNRTNAGMGTLFSYIFTIPFRLKKIEQPAYSIATKKKGSGGSPNLQPDYFDFTFTGRAL